MRLETLDSLKNGIRKEYLDLKVLNPSDRALHYIVLNDYGFEMNPWLEKEFAEKFEHPLHESLSISTRSPEEFRQDLTLRSLLSYYKHLKERKRLSIEG